MLSSDVLFRYLFLSGLTINLTGITKIYDEGHVTKIEIVKICLYFCISAYSQCTDPGYTAQGNGEASIERVWPEMLITKVFTQNTLIW